MEDDRGLVEIEYLLSDDEENEKIKKLKQLLKLLSVVFSVLLVFFLACFIVSAVITGIAFTKEKIFFDPYEEISTHRSTISPTRAPLEIVNTCSNKSLRLTSVFFNDKGKPKALEERFMKYFPQEVMAFIEVCLPQVYFVIHFGKTIIMIDDNDFEEVKRYESELAWNSKKIQMTATKSRIVISDNSDFLHIFNLDLTNKTSVSLNEGLLPIQLNGMFYDFSTDTLLVYETNLGIHILDNNFKKQKLLRLEINENLFLYKVAENIIFFGSLNGQIGRYDIEKMEPEFQRFQSCSNKTSLVGFIADPDGLLLTICSIVVNEEDYSKDLELFTYGYVNYFNNDKWLISKKTKYATRTLVIDSKYNAVSNILIPSQSLFALTWDSVKYEY